MIILLHAGHFTPTVYAISFTYGFKSVLKFGVKCQYFESGSIIDLA